MTGKQCHWIGPTGLILFGLAFSSLPALRGEDFFQQQVAPIFAKRCSTCHDSGNPKGDLALHTSEALLAGGYMEPGDATASQLMQLLTPEKNGRALMPQDAEPLSEAERAAIAKWINAGAVWSSRLRDPFAQHRQALCPLCAGTDCRRCIVSR